MQLLSVLSANGFIASRSTIYGIHNSFSCVSIFHSYTCEVFSHMLDVLFIDRREKCINGDCSCILLWIAPEFQYKAVVCVGRMWRIPML